MQKLKRIPIEVNNFKELIEGQYCYVDKTDIIKNIIEKGLYVTDFLCPRRFGKTLTISMLENYFNIKKKEENKNLFKGLKIENASDDVKEAQGKYPVISLNLKNVKDVTWDKEFKKIKEKMSELYYENIEVLELLNETEKEDYNAVLLRKANETVYKLSLKNLSKYLMRYYKQKVIILIDEYDAPIEKGFINGFYDDVINFMHIFLGEALKTNDCLKFGYLTGILRVPKDGTLSGFNKFVIYSILNQNYSKYFGFLPKEVDRLLDEYGIENKEEVKRWYGGYNFGGTEIYNPWSILNVLEKKKVQPYWENTGGTALLENMLKNAGGDVKKDLEDLMEGKIVKSGLNENVEYSEIIGSRNNILNFLLMYGYVTLVDTERREEIITAKLKIPNLEVKIAFKTIVERWFKINNACKEITDFQKAILRDDKELAEIILNQLMLKSIGYFDNVENFYHGFVLGLLVDMGENYIVESNREGGYGRYDMKNRGITNILKYGIAFNNKKVVMIR